MPSSLLTASSSTRCEFVSDSGIGSFTDLAVLVREALEILVGELSELSCLDARRFSGMAWSVVVVAVTGRALLVADLPRVKAKDDFLDGVLALLTLSLTIDAVSIAVLLADEMLSRATCVMGAGFLGQVLLYHEVRSEA